MQSYNFALDIQLRVAHGILQPRRRREQHRVCSSVSTGTDKAGPAGTQPRARGAEHDACGWSSGASRSSPATRVRSLTRVGWRSGAAFALIAAAALARGARGRRPRAPRRPARVLRARARWLGTRAARPAAPHPALAAAFETDEAQEIEGTVVRGPESTGTGARLIVALTQIAGGAGRPGRWRCPSCRAGPTSGRASSIACRARLRELRGTRNPGLPDPALALRAAGIDALAGVPEAGAITRVAEPDGGGPRRIAFLARRALRAAIDRERARRRGGVPQDRRARRPPRHRRRRRGGIPRRGRDARAVGLGAAPGGRGDAAVLPRPRGGGARSAPAPLRRPARGRRRGRPARRSRSSRW